MRNRDSGHAEPFHCLIDEAFGAGVEVARGVRSQQSRIYANTFICHYVLLLILDSTLFKRKFITCFCARFKQSNFTNAYYFFHY